jgi:hypothetical protein
MGNGEGSSAGGATRRKEGAQARSCHAEEDDIGGGLAGSGAGKDTRSVEAGPGQ